MIGKKLWKSLVTNTLRCFGRLNFNAQGRDFLITDPIICKHLFKHVTYVTPGMAAPSPTYTEL